MPRCFWCWYRAFGRTIPASGARPPRRNWRSGIPIWTRPAAVTGGQGFGIGRAGHLCRPMRGLPRRRRARHRYFLCPGGGYHRCRRGEGRVAGLQGAQPSEVSTLMMLPTLTTLLDYTARAMPFGAGVRSATMRCSQSPPTCCTWAAWWMASLYSIDQVPNWPSNDYPIAMASAPTMVCGREPLRSMAAWATVVSLSPTARAAWLTVTPDPGSRQGMTGASRGVSLYVLCY